MSAGKEYLNQLLDILKDMEDITYRRMAGEYPLYYRGKLFGGIYGDRLLLKKTPSAERILGDVKCVVPYPGAPEMILYEPGEAGRFGDPEKLMQVIEEMYDDLPEPKRSRSRADSQIRMEKK